MKNSISYLALLLCILFGDISVSRSQWTKTSGPAKANSFVTQGSNLFASTRDSGVYLSTDNGTSWQRASNGLGFSWCSVLAASGTDVFVGGTVGGGVYRSQDASSNWTPANDGLTNDWVRALAVSGSNVFAGTINNGAASEPGVYRSSDNGTSWVATTLMDPVGDGINTLAAFGTTLFAGLNNTGILRSTNNGSDWISVNNGLADTSINTIVKLGNKLFAGTQNFKGTGGVFVSTDDGENWTITGLTNTDVRSLIAVGGNLFAGTGGDGVLLSMDEGASWTTVNTGLTKPLIGALILSGSDLIAATGGSGIWKRPLAEFMSGIHTTEVPLLRIEASPNPTTGLVTITGLPPHSSVAVVNLLGSPVGKPVGSDGEVITIDLSQQPAGAYWVHAVVNRSHTVKMVVRN